MDDQGRAVANAWIGVDRDSDSWPRHRRFGGLGPDFRVEKDGTFTIPRLADGKLTFKVSAPGFKTTSHTFPTDEVDALVRLRPITDPMVYRAKVVDAEGRPVAGANVVLAWRPVTLDSNREHGNRQMKTDANGIANFGPLLTAPATQTILHSQTMMTCDMPGYDLAISPTAGGAEDLDVVLTLSKSSSHWKGRVVDSDGKPIEGAAVSLAGYATTRERPLIDMDILGNDHIFSRLGHTTAANGAFEIPRLPKDAWVRIKITSQGKRTLYSDFDPDSDKGEVKLFEMQKADP